MPDYGHEVELGYFLVPDAADADINSVIDRLQADHRRVADKLQALGENLLARLDYEERSLEATVLRIGEFAYRQ